MWARGLRELLIPKSLDSAAGSHVYLERFGKITNHFGPILFNSISIFFNNIRVLLQRAWYKGDLTREQSCRVLWNKPPGTFLVRMSAHPSHACVISVVLAGAGPSSIGHYVIIQEVRVLCVCGVCLQYVCCCAICFLTRAYVRIGWSRLLPRPRAATRASVLPHAAAACGPLHSHGRAEGGVQL